MTVPELWAWVALAVSMTGLLLWFLLGLLSRGLEFHRIHIEAERQRTEDATLAEVRAIDERLAALERATRVTSVGQPRAVR